MEHIKTTCQTCGTQFPPNRPDICPICNDDRQYFLEDGQSWTNTVQIAANHKVNIKQLNPSLYELRVTPQFAIAQRALLLLSPGGNNFMGLHTAA
jgi:hypothetical protein